MIKTLLCIVFLAFSTAFAQTEHTFSNIDDSKAIDSGEPDAVGWGVCTDCAGGKNEERARTPSRDGESREFRLEGPAFANALWWYKVGPNNTANKFTFDFWVQVDKEMKHAEALEFDVFQFVQGVEFMFGMQCNYRSGLWDVWNKGGGMKKPAWVPSSVRCDKFKPKVWYHVVMRVHHDPYPNPTPNLTSGFPKQFYDSITVGRLSSGKPISTTYDLGLESPAGPTTLPYPKWSDNLGVQFQIDNSGKRAKMSEWVDLVNLTIQ